jgi:hypothetical protein
VGRLEYPRPPRLASHPVRLAPWPVFLAARERLLAELDDRLAVREGEPKPQVMALCGRGGAGKTSVALEYVHHHLAEIGVAWQFPADDSALMAAEFGELAAQMGALVLLSTLTTRHGIAYVIAAQNDNTRTEAPYRDVLARELRVLGADHPSTLITQEGIASVTAQQGDHAEVEAKYRQVLAARERVLGADHTDTTNTRYQIARSWPPWTSIPKPKPNTGRR